jgi:nitrite reductase/ring-hydroxylating ferredoxin subunit
MAREVRVCESTALVDGGEGVRFEASVDGVAEPAFAVRYAGRVHAYVNRCAHIPYELDWQPGKFFDSDGLYIMCSTHGALYEPETGRCAGGPCARRGLLRVPVTERDGHVFALPADAASTPNS